MSQQNPYPDDPGYRPPEQSGYPDQPVSYELEQQPGYDPTSSLPVMGGATPQPQQPGYDPNTASMPVTGPPQQPGYGAPPPAPPPKSNSGTIIGIGVGVIVLVLVAGAALWFFMLRGGEDPGGGGPAGSDSGGADAAGDKREVFPDSHTVSEKPPKEDSTWGIEKPDGYDKCATTNLDPVESVVPFDGTPKGDTDANDDGTGRMTCEGTMAGHVSEDGQSRVTGTFYIDFDAAKDTDAGKENFKTIWDGSSGYGDPKKLDIGEEAEVRTKTEDDVRDVAIGYRFGNVTGIARISLAFGAEYAEPDQEMLTNVLIDVIYSGLNG